MKTEKLLQEDALRQISSDIPKIFYSQKFVPCSENFTIISSLYLLCKHKERFLFKDLLMF